MTFLKKNESDTNEKSELFKNSDISLEEQNILEYFTDKEEDEFNYNNFYIEESLRCYRAIYLICNKKN